MKSYTEQLIKAQDEYISFLSSEYSSLHSFTWAHGIKAIPEVVKKGEELRENIAQARTLLAEQDILKNDYEKGKSDAEERMNPYIDDLKEENFEQLAQIGRMQEEINDLKTKLESSDNKKYISENSELVGDKSQEQDSGVPTIDEMRKAMQHFKETGSCSKYTHFEVFQQGVKYALSLPSPAPVQQTKK